MASPCSFLHCRSPGKGKNHAKCAKWVEHSGQFGIIYNHDQYGIILIMQMAICEMLSLKKYEIPYQVTISSAIENAKKFSSEDSTAFVNGILDTIHKTL